MDINTGRTYETLAAALRDGVSPSDVAHVEQRVGDLPIVTFKTGPFKNRVYRRTEHGLVRVDGKR